MNNIFKNLIGNEHLKSLLTNDIVNRTVNHAYIIEGDRGSGRHTVAAEMIRALACVGNKEAVPCGTCPNCKKIAEGMFADIYILNKSDAATVSVDSVRKMLETVSYSPNEDSDYKFYIIEDGEKMTTGAQNALLLTLEEPPEYAVFFILCTDSAALLETVRSRAVTLKTERFSPSFVLEHLKNDKKLKGTAEDKLKIAASLSGGSLGFAKELCSAKSKYTKLFEDATLFTENLCKRKGSDNLLLMTQSKLTRAEYADFFKLVLYALRDLIAYKNGADELIFYTSRDNAAALCSGITLSQLFRLYDAVTAACDDITASNANITLVITHLVSLSL